MRRADRLFQIVQLLRGRRVVTAARLAEQLEISERTVYRDIRDLILSGVPIRGEAGVGYNLPKGFDLPPLMFNSEEIQALVMGTRLVKGWADPALAKAAESALSKVESVLPDRLRDLVEATAIYVPGFHVPPSSRNELEPLRDSLTRRLKVHFHYVRADGQHSERTVRPLALFYWGTGWSLSAWCELRDGFRSFRLDRIDKLQRLDAGFDAEPGKTLEDYLEQREQL